MANRILRDWTQSENINQLSENAEVFFTRLIMKADDYGCYYGSLKLLKAALYPLREISNENLQSSINECNTNGLILLYVIEGKQFIKINNFGQRLRIMKSKFPQPTDRNSLTTDRNSPTTDRNSPLETKRSRNEVETKRNETEGVFMDEKYQLPYEIINGEKIVGSDNARKMGGMSIHAIKIHCQNIGVEYGGEYGI